MNVGVIIAAAGHGTRFGASQKLDQDVGGRPLLLRTVELFTKREEVQAIVVAAPPDKLDEFRSKYGPSLGFHGAGIVAGGREFRWETVHNALPEVPEACTHIAVHDAARPAVSKELLDRLFEAARSLSAVVPAVRITATVKRLSADTVDVADLEGDVLADAILGDAGRPALSASTIIETVDREGLVEVQTPQVFEAGLLRRAYAQDDLGGATDDAALVERLGEAVYAVEGDVTNLKVTTPGDLRLVRAILGVRAPAERAAHKRF
ncbi:MAG: IspD/TarI family cytidylyltransferase [Planctomycetota bacterium]|jgi:2-C-methyl-D-erythritol 4-phosphate cytidylyltransferase